MKKRVPKFGDPEDIKTLKKGKTKNYNKKLKKDQKITCALKGCKTQYTPREKGNKYNQEFCSLECCNEFAALFGGGGRPTKWKRSYNQKIIDYFKVPAYTEVVEYVETENYIGGKTVTKERKKRVPSDFPLFEGFAAEINTTPQTLLSWSKKENTLKYPGFLEAYAICKAIQHRILVVGTLNGLYNSPFATFIAKNITELKDKQELEHSTPEGKPMEYKIFV